MASLNCQTINPCFLFVLGIHQWFHGFSNMEPLDENVEGLSSSVKCCSLLLWKCNQRLIHSIFMYVHGFAGLIPQVTWANKAIYNIEVDNLAQKKKQVLTSLFFGHQVYQRIMSWNRVRPRSLKCNPYGVNTYQMGMNIQLSNILKFQSRCKASNLLP